MFDATPILEKLVNDPKIGQKEEFETIRYYDNCKEVKVENEAKLKETEDHLKAFNEKYGDADELLKTPEQFMMEREVAEKFKSVKQKRAEYREYLKQRRTYFKTILAQFHEWSEEERIKMLKLYNRCGFKPNRIANLMQTRSRAEVENELIELERNYRWHRSKDLTIKRWETSKP